MICGELDLPEGASVVRAVAEYWVGFRSEGVVGMMSKGMRIGTGEKPLSHRHISPTYQPITPLVRNLVLVAQVHKYIKR